MEKERAAAAKPSDTIAIVFVLLNSVNYNTLVPPVKPQRRTDFLRRREGQTAVYGQRKVLRRAAGKKPLYYNRGDATCNNQPARGNDTQQPAGATRG